MSTLRKRGEAIRTFILEHVEAHPADIARIAADKFACSRQAMNKHVRQLVADGSLLEEGRTKGKFYRLPAQASWTKTYQLVPGISESAVWVADVAPALGPLPDNVRLLWQHGFTEMFNNAVDHSGGSRIKVAFEKSATTTTITITDDGIGIFRKIQAALGLADERHAVLELAKGRYTTDPKNHSGEGIFFTSRMFDEFWILSGGVAFSHQFDDESDWILERNQPDKGTSVVMTLKNHTARTTKQVFDEFTTGDDYGFTKTVVPVRLAQYGDDQLVSRSQAKRLLSRINRFKVALLDFAGVSMIGQSFADEIFRVFVKQNPQVEIVPTNVNAEVQLMINRATVRGTETDTEPQA